MTPVGNPDRRPYRRTPAADLAQALHERPQRKGNAYYVPCPAHGGEDPNLGIFDLDNDRGPGVKCWSRGCDSDAIWQAIHGRLGWSDDRRPAPQVRTSKAQGSGRQARIWKDLPPSLKGKGKANAHWIYRQANGTPVLAVCRWDTPDGKKDIRQYKPVPGGWQAGNIGGQRPPLYLPELMAAPDTPVLIAEGEKACDALRSACAGHALATTWSQGTDSMHRTDWSPLKGRRIYIDSDADTKGRNAARNVANRLANLDCTVQIRLREGEDGSDFADDAHRLGNDAALAAFRDACRPHVPEAGTTPADGEESGNDGNDKPPPQVMDPYTPNEIEDAWAAWIRERYCTIDGRPCERGAALEYRACLLPDVVARWTAFRRVLEPTGRVDPDMLAAWHGASLTRMAANVARSTLREPELERQPVRAGHLLNTSDGVWNLISNTITDHDRIQPGSDLWPDGHVWTYCLPVAPATPEDKDLVQALATAWHPDATEREYFWCLLASGLLDLPVKIFADCWGDTNTGKSTFRMVLEDALSPLTTTLEAKDVRRGNHTHQGSIKDALQQGARFVLYPSETGSGDANHALLKSWSGRDKERVRGSGDAHGQETTRRYTGLLILTGNPPPPEHHDDQALARRQRIVHFGTEQIIDSPEGWAHQRKFEADLEAALRRPSFTQALLLCILGHAAIVLDRGLPHTPESMEAARREQASTAAGIEDPLEAALLKTEWQWDGQQRTVGDWIRLWDLDPQTYPEGTVGGRMTKRGWRKAQVKQEDGTRPNLRWPAHQPA